MTLTFQRHKKPQDKTIIAKQTHKNNNRLSKNTIWWNVYQSIGNAMFHHTSLESTIIPIQWITIHNATGEYSWKQHSTEKHHEKHNIWLWTGRTESPTPELSKHNSNVNSVPEQKHSSPTITLPWPSPGNKQFTERCIKTSKQIIIGTIWSQIN